MRLPRWIAFLDGGQPFSNKIGLDLVMRVV
jgi:hypothetical protein